MRRRDVWMNRMWMARRSWSVASGRRVLCMRRCTRTTNKQLAERWAKGRVHYLSRPHLSRPARCHSLITMVNCLDCHKVSTRDGQSGTNWPSTESKMTKWRDWVKMMDFNGEKDGESEWQAMIFIVNSKPPPHFWRVHSTSAPQTRSFFSRKREMKEWKCVQYEHNNSHLKFILDNTIFVWLSWFEINWLFCFCCFLFRK